MVYDINRCEYVMSTYEFSTPFSTYMALTLPVINKWKQRSKISRISINFGHILCNFDVGNLSNQNDIQGNIESQQRQLSLLPSFEQSLVGLKMQCTCRLHVRIYAWTGFTTAGVFTPHIVGFSLLSSQEIQFRLLHRLIFDAYLFMLIIYITPFQNLLIITHRPPMNKKCFKWLMKPRRWS